MEEQKEKAGTFALIMSFLFPIVGIILYFVNKNKVVNANMYLILALIGFVVSIILQTMANALC